jgi:hypothetical protein
VAAVRLAAASVCQAGPEENGPPLPVAAAVIAVQLPSGRPVNMAEGSGV